jgi:hypothetical protein
MKVSPWRAGPSKDKSGCARVVPLEPGKSVLTRMSVAGALRCMLARGLSITLFRQPLGRRVDDSPASPTAPASVSSRYREGARSSVLVPGSPNCSCRTQPPHPHGLNSRMIAVEARGCRESDGLIAGARTIFVYRIFRLRPRASTAFTAENSRRASWRSRRRLQWADERASDRGFGRRATRRYGARKSAW